MHKLLTDRPTDSVQQKQHEQTLVPWLDGSSVKLCPNCAKKFNIARRQHHCRLCGSIMCKECSQFLPINYAGDLHIKSKNQMFTISKINSKIFFFLTSFIGKSNSFITKWQ